MKQQSYFIVQRFHSVLLKYVYDSVADFDNV